MSARRDAPLVAGAAHRSTGSSASRTAQREQAYELRLRGRTLRQIAGDMGISHSTVHDLLREEIDNRLDPLKDQYLQYELDRLDHMQQAAVALLENPGKQVLAPGPDGELITWVIMDHDRINKAINTLVRISESRRKLIGLDAPVKVQGDLTVTETTQEDLELQELVRDAKARAAAQAEKIRQAGGPVPEGNL